MTEPFEWEGDWSAIAGTTERDSLEKELQRELCPTHTLYGIGAVALARRWRRDDVLFSLKDGRFAQVHLTWRSETNPKWPETQIYANFEEWKSISAENR